MEKEKKNEEQEEEKKKKKEEEEEEEEKFSPISISHPNLFSTPFHDLHPIQTSPSSTPAPTPPDLPLSCALSKNNPSVSIKKTSSANRVSLEAYNMCGNLMAIS